MNMSLVKYANIEFYGTDVASGEVRVFLNSSGIEAFTDSYQPLYKCAWEEVRVLQIKKRDQCIVKITLLSGLKKKLKLENYCEMDRFFVAAQAYANVKKAVGWFMGRKIMYIQGDQNEVQQHEMPRRAAIMEVSMERVEYRQVTMVKSPVNALVPPPPPPPPVMAQLEPTTRAIDAAPVPTTAAVPTQAPDFVAELKANFAKGLLMPKERPKLPTNIVIRKQELAIEQSQVVSCSKDRQHHQLSVKVMKKVTYDDLVAEVKKFQAQNMKPSDIKGTKSEKIVESVEESMTVMESMTATSVISLTMAHESSFKCPSTPENLPVVNLATPMAKFVPRRPKELIWELNELDNRYEDEPIPVVVEEEPVQVPEQIVVVAEVHQNPEPELVPQVDQPPSPQPEQTCETKRSKRQPFGPIDELKAFAYAFKQNLKPSDVREHWRQTDRPVLEVPSSEEEWSEELTSAKTSTPIRPKETPVVEKVQPMKKPKATPKSHVDALKEYFANRRTPPKIVGAVLKDHASAFTSQDITNVLDQEEDDEPEMSGKLEDFDWQSPEFTKRQPKPNVVQQRRHSCPALRRFRPSLCSIWEDEEDPWETRPFVPFEIYEDGDQDDGHLQSEVQALSPEHESHRPFIQPPSPTGAEKRFNVGFAVPLPDTWVRADYRTLCRKPKCCDWNPNRSNMAIISVDGRLHRIPEDRFWKEKRAGFFVGREMFTCCLGYRPVEAKPKRLRFADQECTHRNRFCDCSAHLD